MRDKSHEFEDDTPPHRITTAEARRTRILSEQPLRSTFRVHPHKTGTVRGGKKKKKNYTYKKKKKTKNTKQEKGRPMNQG